MKQNLKVFLAGLLVFLSLSSGMGQNSIGVQMVWEQRDDNDSETALSYRWSARGLTHPLVSPTGWRFGRGARWNWERIVTIELERKRAENSGGDENTAVLPPTHWTSGGGNFTQAGHSTIVLAGNNWGGATTINTYTLIVGGGTSGSIGSGNVADYGTLTFNRMDENDGSRIVGGTGLVQKGSGTIILANNNFGTDQSLNIVSGGTLIVGGSCSSSLASENVVNNAQLIFRRADNIVIPAASAVPEPSALSLFLAASGLLFAGRRRNPLNQAQ